MKKIVISTALILTLVLSASLNHASAGPALNALYSAICNSKYPYALKTGCKGYWQLRIIHDGKKAEALNWCANGKNGCPRFFQGNDLVKCKEGCNYANSQDN